jgi:hypothetical protein
MQCKVVVVVVVHQVFSFSLRFAPGLIAEIGGSMPNLVSGLISEKKVYHFAFLLLKEKS